MPIKTQHSPGPWKFHYEPDQFDSARDILRVVDGCEHSMSHPQGPITLCNVNVAAFAPHVDEAIANARLIAAAPALLEALQALFENCTMVHTHWGEGDNTKQANAAIKAARAAITAVTGE